jgi:CRISPR-associated protein Cmr2
MFRSDYWQHKLSVYLHDPPHKCLNIPGHEQWAKEIAEELGCSIAASEQYKNADMIASGLTRVATPGYSKDESQNGAVDFVKAPFITHPVVNCAPLKFDLPDGIKPADVHMALLKLLAQDMESMPRSVNDEERARRIFLYLHFALKKRLRTTNVGGLGAAWDFLPADTRMPDHPIWQHTALASAIASSLREDGSGNVSLAVFAITPVQAFIAKARKLRDHWFGSVILSYLTFTAIRHLAQTFGPDHVVYPSLHDQSLVEGWLGKEYGMAGLLTETDPLMKKILAGGSDIAAFPNKFVFIAPTAGAEEICRGIQEAVQQEWLRIAGIVRDFIGKGDVFTQLFDYQISDYWQFSFASARLSKLDETGNLGRLLHKDKWQYETETIEVFSRKYGTATARIYAATHSLIQGVLAAAKQKPNRLRKPQNGEKCPLCGEHEVLHSVSHPENHTAREYKIGIESFWNGLRDRFNAEGSCSEVGRNERLCAVCAVKRFLPQALKQQKLKDELLYDVIINADKFPATTGIAAAAYLEKMVEAGILPSERRLKFIDHLHDSRKDEGLDQEAPSELKMIVEAGKKKNIKLTNRDNYYALLLMDGDKMGDLINGTTVTAQWENVIHPELLDRYRIPAFKPPKDELRERLNKTRTLNPALHAAISDSLNSFARFAVAPLVEKNGGRLIYAGGDDVCAILPLDAALATADAIRKAYTAGFVHYTEQGVEPCNGSVSLSGKLGVHFGAAPAISISAAIVIAHHKQPLREVLKDAHALLDGVAKRQTGRNAVAIRLKKRSGGDRDFACKWDATNPFMDGETILESFRGVADSAGDILSSSLVYRLASLKEAIAPLKTSQAADKEKIRKLFAYEVGHSGLLNKEQKEQVNTIAGRLAGVTLNADSNADNDVFNPETAVIAGFLGRRSHE